MKLIYTKHAKARISKRSLSYTGVEQTLTNPDYKKTLDKNEVKFIKQHGTRCYHVVAKYLPDERAWLILSAWVRGEQDRPDLLWQILAAPFKALWWLLKLLFGRH